MKKTFRSFRHAIDGIQYAWQSERHMKFHSFAAVLVILVGWQVQLSTIEWFIVILLIAGMLAFEMLNTAIERIVDLVSPEYHELAKRAKDVAAGAVLIYAFSAGVIGLYIFIPKWFG